MKSIFVLQKGIRNTDMHNVNKCMILSLSEDTKCMKIIFFCTAFEWSTLACLKVITIIFPEDKMVALTFLCIMMHMMFMIQDVLNTSECRVVAFLFVRMLLFI